MTGNPHDGGASPLTATEWLLSSIETVPEFLYEGAVEPVTLSLDASGRASGSAGCNRYTGPYWLEESSRLRFGPIAATRKLCTPPVMQTETLFLRLLGSAHAFELFDGRLDIVCDEGRLVFVGRSL